MVIKMPPTVKRNDIPGIARQSQVRVSASPWYCSPNSHSNMGAVSQNKPAKTRPYKKTEAKIQLIKYFPRVGLCEVSRNSLGMAESSSAITGKVAAPITRDAAAYKPLTPKGKSFTANILSSSLGPAAVSAKVA